MTDTTARGFDGEVKRRTRLDDARETLRTLVGSTDATDVSLGRAEGRVLASPPTAARDVPDARTATADGYAVRAADTFGASTRAPAVLDARDGTDGPDAGTATPVAAGGPLPAGTDAVVPASDADVRGGSVEVLAPVATGAHVVTAGADAAAGDDLLAAGDRLSPGAVALLCEAGVQRVSVFARPDVVVLPVGDALADGARPDTDGPLVASLVARWGGEVERASPVASDAEAVGDALEAAADADVVVTTGATGSGADDCVPAALSARGSLAVRGLALDPGRTAGFGSVDGTPVVALPGDPAACLCAAVHLLRFAVGVAAGAPADVATPPPSVDATLQRKVESRPGVRTCTPVALDARDGGDARAAPLGTGRAGLAAADGWVVLPERAEGVAADRSVAVERWETESWAAPDASGGWAA